MMRSLFSGVSGLRVHQTKMDVIGNNIANVNTVGYKASRVTFNEVFSQTIGGASAANAASNRGGVNPMQIGLGVNVASIDKLMTTGASQRTDNPFDLMIQGDGFFIVGDGSGTYFTRAGALNLDAAGNLVTSTGLKVMGWNANTDGTEISRGVVGPIEITGEKEYVTPNVTTQIDFSGNLNAETNTATAKTMSMTFYDSVGNSYVVDAKMQYVKDKDAVTGAGADGWTYSIINVAYPNGDRSKAVAISVNPKGEIEFTGGTVDNPPKSVMLGMVNFNTNGLPTGFVPGTYDPEAATPADRWKPDATAKINYSATSFVLKVVGGTEKSVTTGSTTATVVDPNNLAPSAMFGTTITLPDGTTIDSGIIVDFSKLTQFGKETSNATSKAKNGNGPGTLNGISIGSDGTIMGRYSNGQTKLLGQIPVAVFKNPAGLEKVGDNLFVTTANSGDFDGIGQEVTTGGGSMLGGVLEMSNVDLSSEFVEMITTQRGFQANSRVITTSDELLQELVNLKR